jgi:cytochrome c-type biogenesis protein CcmH/NrfG
LNPNQAPGWHALGITYIQLNKNAEAVGAISHAIKLNPNQPTYYNNLAAAYAEMARWQDAFNALNDEKPLAEKLNNATVWYKLGNGYARLEQAQPAVSAYQHAIRLNPNWAQAWTNLGTMLQLDRIINQQARQNLEIQRHNDGTLNINDHLPSCGGYEPVKWTRSDASGRHPGP